MTGPIQYVSDDRCTLVTFWPSNGRMHVTVREHPGDTWPPTVEVKPEKHGEYLRPALP